MIKSLRLILLPSVLLAGILEVPRAEPGDTQKMVDKTFQTSKGTLKYLLFVPKGYVATQRYPLVVSLRGAGNTYTGATNDNDQAHPWIEDSIQARVPHFIMVPETNEGSWGGPIGPGGISNGVMSAPAAAVLEGIEYLKTQYSLDTNRFIIAGFSIGGTGTYHLLETKSGYWAAAAPASAGPDTTKMDAIAKTPIWHHQGSLDNNAGAGRRTATALENHHHPVVRMVCDYTINTSAGWRTEIAKGGKPEDIIFKNAKAPVTVDSLRRAIAAGANYIYTEMTGGTHEAGWIGTAHNPLLATWAFSKVRGGTTVSLAPKVAGAWAKRNGSLLSFSAVSGNVDGKVFSLTGQSLGGTGSIPAGRLGEQAFILKAETPVR